MCIIAYKPQGERLPKEKTITICMKNNKDGSGYMFNTPKGVIGRKGFNHAEVLYDNLYKDLHFYKVKEKDASIAIHCRIGTAGLIKPENCHPFPITKNIGYLQSLFTISDKAMMHNGMLDIRDDKYPNLSDTQIFVRNVLSEIDLTSKGINILLDMVINPSKVIVFDKNGLLLSFGKWEKENGIFYSNTSYKEHSWGYINYSKWDDWDFAGAKKSKSTCYFCDIPITKMNTALMTETEKDNFGIPATKHICDWCYDWCVKNYE